MPSAQIQLHSVTLFSTAGHCTARCAPLFKNDEKGNFLYYIEY